MTIGVLSFEIRLPEARSLKDKRQVVRSLKERLRSRHNVAVGETDDHAQVWQRAEIVVVSVASRRDPLERLFESIVAEAESWIPGYLIETGRDYLEGADGGPRGWDVEG